MMPDIKSMIVDTANQLGLDPNLALKQANIESGYNPSAVSDAGAVGVMQVLPSTAADMGVSEQQLYDPATNIKTGLTYFKQQLDRFGDTKAALAAYHDGPEKVQEIGGDYSKLGPAGQKYLSDLGYPIGDDPTRLRKLKLQLQLLQLQKQKATSPQQGATTPTPEGASQDSGTSFQGNIATEIAQGFNTGLAKLSGMFGDAAKREDVWNSLRNVGFNPPAPLTTDSILNTWHNMGLTPSADDAEKNHDLVFKIGDMLGQSTLPAAAPLMRARQVTMLADALAQEMGGKATLDLQTLGQGLFGPTVLTAATQPSSYAAGEALIAAGAGVGATIANYMFPSNQTAEMLGQMMGAALRPADMIARLAKTGYTAASSAIKFATSPEEVQNVASKIIQQSVDRPGELEAVRGQLSKPSDLLPGAPVPVAKELGKPGVLSLEKALMDKSEQLKDGIAEMISSSQGEIDKQLQQLRGMGQAEATQKFIQDRVDRLQTALNLRMHQAVNEAEAALAKISPSSPREALNTRMRGIIDLALKDARYQEKELYSMVDRTQPASIANGKDKLKEIVSEMNPDPRISRIKDVPDWLRSSLIGDAKRPAIPTDTTVGNLIDIRSKLLDEIRDTNAGVNPNRNSVRIMGEVADALLKDIKTVDDPNIRVAHTFSKDLNDRFTRGTVGDILGYTGTGELRTDPMTTLENSLKAKGPQGGLAFDHLMNAVGVSTSPGDTRFANFQDITRSYIADQFQRTFPDGIVKPTTGRKFLLDHAEVLDRIPALKADIQNAIQSQDKAKFYQDLNQKYIQKFDSAAKNKSAATVVLGGDVDRKITSAINNNPDVAMPALLRAAVKDPSGQAVAGLRAAVIDNFKAFAKAGGRESLDGVPIYKGKDMVNYIQSNESWLQRVLTPDQLNSMKTIAKTAKSIENRANAGYPGQKILDESPHELADLVLSVMGANLSKPFASGMGAPMVVAGRFASLARNWGRKFISKIPLANLEGVLTQAMTDRNLFNALVSRPVTYRQAVIKYKTLKAALYPMVPQAFDQTPFFTQEQDNYNKKEQSNTQTNALQSRFTR